MREIKNIIIVAFAGLLASCGSSHKTAQPKPAPPPPPPTSPTLPQPAPVQPEAPVHISVAYPVPGQLRPQVESNFIFGTAGNGNATLTINDQVVPLAKNGAFLAFLPMPSDGVYHLTAQRKEMIDSLTVAYSTKQISAGSTAPSHPASRSLESGFYRIIKAGDTLQTGNDVAPGAKTPDGNREWFFPHDALVHVVDHQGAYGKIELEKNVFAWVADSSFGPNTNRGARVERGGMKPSAGYVDLTFPGNYNPFKITPEGTSMRVRLYGRAQPGMFDVSQRDPLINNISYDSTGQSTEFTVLLAKPVWGFKAFYDDAGSLVVRVRRPPTIDRDNPLKGLRIMVDPGHPPAGAIGPTMLTEKEANLAIALKLRDQLAAKGATVLMTHTGLNGIVSDYDQVLELNTRSELAVRENVDLMVSVHNNAFPDGVNPFTNYGTTTFYYHPFSAPLAGELDREIAAVTGIPNLGALTKSLAICRPTWMPCALTESLYMMFPDQEQALRDPKFLDQLAAAHVRGIESFVRGQVQ